MDAMAKIDDEIRRTLRDALERQLAQRERDAEKERRAARRCVETSPDDAAEFRRFAAYDDRFVSHLRQMIEFLKSAPMPEDTR